MKILSHGKYHDKTLIFWCNCCDCTFEAESGEYKTTEGALGNTHEATCPECGATVELYA